MLNRLFALTIALSAVAANAQWSQFAGNPRHTGDAAILAQPLRNVLADVVYDPLVPDELEANSGELLIHYAVPLLDGDDVFIAFKELVFIGPFQGIPYWGVKRLRWENGKLV
jgi:hypothetical protein